MAKGKPEGTPIEDLDLYSPVRGKIRRWFKTVEALEAATDEEFLDKPNLGPKILEDAREAVRKLRSEDVGWSRFLGTRVRYTDEEGEVTEKIVLDVDESGRTDLATPHGADRLFRVPYDTTGGDGTWRSL